MARRKRAGDSHGRIGTIKKIYARNRGGHKGSGDVNSAHTEHREMGWVRRSAHGQSGTAYHSGGPA
jgi:hypothetical protein